MEIPLKYTDPTGYQTQAAPGAISWLGGGGGWGERGMGFGGSVNWDYFVPNTSWHQYYGNYAYDTYNWSTEYYEHHTLEGVGTISYDQVYAHDLLPYTNEFYYGAAAVQKYKEEKKAYIKRQKLQKIKPNFSDLDDSHKILEIMKGIREALLQGKRSVDIRDFFDDFPNVVSNGGLLLKGVLVINNSTLKVRMFLGIYSSMRTEVLPIYNGDRPIDGVYWEYLTYGRGKLRIFTIYQNNRNFSLFNYLCR